jgi:hypothetical protein
MRRDASDVRNRNDSQTGNGAARVGHWETLDDSNVDGASREIILSSPLLEDNRFRWHLCGDRNGYLGGYSLTL